MFQEQAQGIFPVVVDDQAVSSRKGFEDGLPFLIGDKYDNLVISLWDVDGLQFCAPFPVEQIFVNYLVRDIHDAFRKHFTVLHFADHAGTVGFMVNKEALGDVLVPKSWKDLLDPKYDGMVGFLDPSSAFVGYACAVAANQALGGSLDNFKPGIEFYKKLLENHPIIPKQTAYARCLSGEIPILFDYDFDAYRSGKNLKRKCVTTPFSLRLFHL